MKVKYENKTYTVLEVAGETIRIKNDEEEFCIHKDEVTPVKKCTKRNAGKD